MLSNIAMKNLLFAAWKNSSRPKTGQFELKLLTSFERHYCLVLAFVPSVHTDSTVVGTQFDTDVFPSQLLTCQTCSSRSVEEIQHRSILPTQHFDQSAGEVMAGSARETAYITRIHEANNIGLFIVLSPLYIHQSAIRIAG